MGAKNRRGQKSVQCSAVQACNQGAVQCSAVQPRCGHAMTEQRALTSRRLVLRARHLRCWTPLPKQKRWEPLWWWGQGGVGGGRARAVGPEVLGGCVRRAACGKVGQTGLAGSGVCGNGRGKAAQLGQATAGGAAAGADATGAGAKEQEIVVQAKRSGVVVKMATDGGIGTATETFETFRTPITCSRPKIQR